MGTFAACSYWTALQVGMFVVSCKTYEFIVGRGLKQAGDPEVTRQMKMSLKTFLVRINAFAQDARRMSLSGRDLALFQVHFQDLS